MLLQAQALESSWLWVLDPPRARCVTQASVISPGLSFLIYELEMLGCISEIVGIPG